MTQLEKLSLVLADGNWHSTEELVQQVGHRFSATMHHAVKRYAYQIEKRRRDGDRQYQYEYRLISVVKPSVTGVTSGTQEQKLRSCDLCG